MGCLRGPSRPVFGVGVTSATARMAGRVRQLAGGCRRMFSSCFKVSPVMEADEAHQHGPHVQRASEPDEVNVLMDEIVEMDEPRTASAALEAGAHERRCEDYAVEEMSGYGQQQQQEMKEEGGGDAEEEGEVGDGDATLLTGGEQVVLQQLDTQAPADCQAREGADAAVTVVALRAGAAPSKGQCLQVQNQVVRALSPVRAVSPQQPSADQQQQEHQQRQQRRILPAFDPSLTAGFFTTSDAPVDAGLELGDDAAEWDQFGGQQGALEEEAFVAAYTSAISPRTRALHEAKAQALADEILREVAGRSCFT